MGIYPFAWSSLTFLGVEKGVDCGRETFWNFSPWETLISSVSTCPSSVGESRIVSVTAYCAGSSHVGYPSRSGASVGNESESGDVYVEGTWNRISFCVVGTENRTFCAGNGLENGIADVFCLETLILSVICSWICFVSFSPSLVLGIGDLFLMVQWHLQWLAAPP